ncbi:dihydrofolate reductase family protein [Jiangella sp. DSM 45060]|uniref:dihydrofolate reductase family protein n=1 Tax=Jiangella sp. DSM 45060 TaxID=1798224 RepID=UPI00087AEE4E|nr:dihydrofolate reductase family protein [Jiangella sp. DSM 45060]SDS95036.1 RibD C-terminal domain-containing protein [Jiangella sp. DSM 45060]
MSVFAALSVSVDGYVTGPDPSPEQALGRTTYDHSGGFGGGSPHPSAPLVVLTHRPVPEASAAQTVAGSIEEAVARARELAGDLDVGLMGTGVTAAALAAGLLDEVTLHQVPVLLGGGTPFFHALPESRPLERVSVVEAPGVTHLTFRVVR